MEQLWPGIGGIIWYKGVARAEAAQWRCLKAEGNTHTHMQKDNRYDLNIYMVIYKYIHIYVWFIFPLFIFYLFIDECSTDENEPVT